eukprot:g41804.t1
MFSCTSANVVYRIHCSRCGLLDIRETKQSNEGSAVNVVYMNFTNTFDKNSCGRLVQKDDMKIGGAVDNEEDGLRIWSDIDQLVNWLEGFNPVKCEMTHFGRSNKGRTYTMNDVSKTGSSRIVEIWNMLPVRAVEAGTLATFKKHLDKHLKHKDIVSYAPSA